MSWGIELNNTSSKLVVGMVGRQLSFHQKISVTVAGWTGDGFQGAAGNHLYVVATTLTDSSRQPIVYYEPEAEGSGRGYCPVRIYYESGVWKIAIARGTVSNQVVLYVFVRKTVPAGSWGIQTFDENEVLAFNSDDRPLAISGIAEMVRGPDSYSDGTNNVYGWDLEGTLGGASLSVPVSARDSNYAVSLPPYFYGSIVGYWLGESDGYNEYVVGGVVKGASWTLKTFTASIGEFGSSAGRPISAPLWRTIKVSFIDGAMYS